MDLLQIFLKFALNIRTELPAYTLGQIHPPQRFQALDLAVNVCLSWLLLPPRERHGPTLPESEWPGGPPGRSPPCNSLRCLPPRLPCGPCSPERCLRTPSPTHLDPNFSSCRSRCPLVAFSELCPPHHASPRLPQSSAPLPPVLSSL